MTDTQDNEAFLLFATLDDAKILLSVINAVFWEKDQIVSCLVSEKSGVKFSTTDSSKAMKASGFLAKDLFSYIAVNLSEDDSVSDNRAVKFHFNVEMLAHCLRIAAVTGDRPCPLEMQWRGYGHPLVVVLRLGDTADVRSEIRTVESLDDDSGNQFTFVDSPAINTLIVRSEWLRQAFHELDWGSSAVTLLLSQSSPINFRLVTEGPSGSCQVDYPQHSDVIESFNCLSRVFSFSYKLALLRPLVKALHSSRQTEISTNREGLLAMNLMIPAPNNASKVSFVKYFLLPMVEDEEMGSEDEDDDAGSAE